jgi:hypothetical protein
MKHNIKPRNYRKEYLQYHGRPKQIKERSARNAARRIMKRKHGLKKMRGKHIDHINHNPRDNRPSNLRIRNASSNMADNKHKS